MNVGANTGGQFSAFMYTEIAGSTVRVSSAVSLITFGISFGATFLLMKIVDGPHRMRWFAAMAVIHVAAYVMPALLGVEVWTLVAMGVLGSIGGAVAGEPMFKIWAQELIPTLYRSTAQGAMIAATRVVAAVVALWTPMLLRASPNLLFWFVAACIAGAALVGLLWIRRFPRVADEEDEARDAADLAAAQSTAPLSTETPSAETPSAETSPTP